ncbi:transposase family protein [Streptomyces sp. NBC_00191]|uniref:transposase family protein n=1 Tax=Streptomyces sp. NBC_00191 TaxID=2975674 RepID=UPI003254C994
MATAEAAPCPGCGTVSRRVHDRYCRRLADVATGGQPVPIRLTVRRFRCKAPSCPRKIADCFPAGRYLAYVAVVLDVPVVTQVRATGQRCPWSWGPHCHPPRGTCRPRSSRHCTYSPVPPRRWPTARQTLLRRAKRRLPLRWPPRGEKMMPSSKSLSWFGRC